MSDETTTAPKAPAALPERLGTPGGEPMLIGHHFSKTGGTSIVRHAREELGLRAFYTYGDAMNRQRRENGRRTLFEFPRRRHDQIKILTGHNLTREVLDLFAHRDILFFTIVREPWARFVSVYKHRHRVRPEGHRPTPGRLLRTQPANPFATELTDRFGGTDPFDVLRRFDMVLTTEHLDEQNGALFRHIGLPPTAERVRVYPEKPDMGLVTPERLLKRDALDADIQRRAAHAWTHGRSLQAFT